MPFLGNNAAWITSRSALGCNHTTASQAVCCQGAGAAGTDDDRFDYNKDPISWFYQVSGPTLTVQLKPRTAQSAGAEHAVNCCCACTCPQNQIKSEEQFQAKKAELRKAAVERLENIFEKKGKVCHTSGQLSSCDVTLRSMQGSIVPTLHGVGSHWAAQHHMRSGTCQHHMRGMMIALMSCVCGLSCALLPAALDH